MGYSLLGAVVGFVLGWTLHWYWTQGADQFGSGGERYTPREEPVWEDTPLVDPSVVQEISVADEKEEVAEEAASPGEAARQPDQGLPADTAVAEAQSGGDSGSAQEEEDASESLVAYCPGCRTRRTILSPTFVVTDRGRHAVRGTCAECGGKMFSFVKRPG